MEGDHVASLPVVIGLAEALAAELREMVRKRLAGYKSPRWIDFVAELPKTTTGKTQRFALRQR